MAILARASITLSTIRDIASTTWYYKLQASTASAPAKPTTNPPTGGWVTTEPTYTSGSTNSLYTTELTVFTDGSFSYSDVSLSSSYEAAKAAYNEATNAKKVATNYLQDVSNDGVFVHEASSTQVLPTDANANGVHISDDVDIIRNGEVVASYGENVTIGREFTQSENRNQIKISSEGFDILNGKITNPQSIAHFGYADRIRRYEQFKGDGVTTQFTLYKDILAIHAIYVTRYRESSHSYYSEVLDDSEYSYDGKVLTLVDPIPDWSVDPILGWLSVYYYSAIDTPFYTLGQRFWDETKKIPIGDYSSTFGYGNYAEGHYSVAEGYDTRASGEAAHAEGDSTVASGLRSHAEGYLANASGPRSHAEGYLANASGETAHAEGSDTIASNSASHAEGGITVASGPCSHAEGYSTTASGAYSHAQCEGTTANKDAQTVLGTYNEVDDEESATTHPSGDTSYGKYAVIIGNGTDDLNRSNALTVDWTGNVEANKFIGNQKVLWSGGSSGRYMTDDASQRIDLSEPVSTQANGLVLVWSRYNPSTSTAYDDNFHIQFVPKWFVANWPGKGETFVIADHNYSGLATKYVYVYDTYINGNANNTKTGTANGVTYANNRYVLRRVIGV